MYQIPWIGRLKFDDRHGRSWFLRHEANDPGLTLVGPGGEPIQVKHKNDLPVLELLVHHSLGETVAARTGLLNVQIYDIIWGKAERGSVARTNIYHKTSSDNVVRIITRLKKLLGGGGDIEPIHYGYRFLGTNVELFVEGGQKPASGTPRAVVPVSGLIIGREAEIKVALSRWLTEQVRPLLIWGTPGIGKSTLALALLNHPTTIERFGSRRYWMRCDGRDSVAKVKQAMALEWFGLAPDLGNDISTVQTGSWIGDDLVRLLNEAPTACVIDNFETLHNAQPVQSEEWLKRFLGNENVRLIVTRQGKQQPAGINWSIPVDLAPLSGEASRELFCKITHNETHSNDPRAAALLDDLGGIPRAIELLAYQAIDADLGILFRRWQDNGTLILKRSGGDERETSLPRTYESAIDGIKEDARRLLGILGSLPIGLAETDLPDIVGTSGFASPLEASQELTRTTLAFREGGRLRLLPPMRDYTNRLHAANAFDAAMIQKYYLQIALALGDPKSLDPLTFVVRDFPRRSALVRFLQESPNVEWAVTRALEAGDAAGLDPAINLVRWSRVRRGSSRAGYEYREALLDQMEKVLDMWNTRAKADCHLCLGEFGRPETEVSHLQMGLTLYEALDDTRGIACCLAALADCESYEQQQRSKAESHARQAEVLFRAAGDYKGVGWSLFLIGVSALDRCTYDDKARTFLNEALRISREQHWTALEFQCLLYLYPIRGIDRAETPASRQRALDELKTLGRKCHLPVQDKVFSLFPKMPDDHLLVELNEST